MTCLTCTHLSLQHNRQMAALHFGHCALEPRTYVYKGINQSCERHTPAKQEVIDKRLAWARKPRGAK